jgi:hypothetical protein
MSIERDAYKYLVAPLGAQCVSLLKERREYWWNSVTINISLFRSEESRRRAFHPME